MEKRVFGYFRGDRDKAQSPCKDCRRHSARCHCDCTDYERYKKRVAEVNAWLEAYNNNPNVTAAYSREKADQNYRRKRRHKR